MRILLLLLLLGVSGPAQSPSAGPSDRQACGCSASSFYRTIIQAMWAQDEDEHPFAEASGFIHIVVHPTWSQEFFADVVLNRKGAATVILYSLPKGAKSVIALLEKEIRRHPCADAKSLAKTLRVQRRSLQTDKKMDDLITEFFALRWVPRRIPADTVRLDATDYELEYIGDDTLRFASDDHESAMVKWIDSFLSVAQHAAH